MNYVLWVKNKFEGFSKFHDFFYLGLLNSCLKFCDPRVCFDYVFNGLKLGHQIIDQNKTLLVFFSLSELLILVKLEF